MQNAVSIRFPPFHKLQLEVAQSPARFRVLVAGRRWGKTLLGASLCIKYALEKRGVAWWVAPSYKMAMVGWRAIVRLGRQIPGAKVKMNELALYLPGGGVVQVRSADNPDSLRGEGLVFLVIDECAFIKEAAWTEALRPALSDNLGDALFISTPKGYNWFWRLWLRTQEPDNAGVWQGWQVPTITNPYMPAGEVEEARKSLPERVYEQEYLALFVRDAGGVFRRVMEAVRANWQEKAVAGHSYVFGVDWGRHNDFTVVSVMDTTLKELVHFDRFSQIGYDLQVGRLAALYRRFRPELIVAERNSIGDPLVERLAGKGLPVMPFDMTNASKKAIIEGLELAFEREQIGILANDILTAELQAFEMSKTPSGLIRYAAPEGIHDDWVISLGLAWWGVQDGAQDIVLFGA